MIRILLASSFAGSSRYLESLLPSLAEHQLTVLLVASGVGAEVLKNDGYKVDHILDVDGIAVSRVFDSFVPDVVFVVPQFSESLEELVIVEARSRNIPSLAGIDHWALFRERFSKTNSYNKVVGSGFQFLPNKVLVNDTFAYDGAIASGIPVELLQIVGSPILEQRWKGISKKKVLQNIADGSQERKKIVLFISEPYSKRYPKGSEFFQGFTEFDVLNDLIEVLSPMSELVIRLHPSQSLDEFTPYVERRDNCRICIDESIDMLLLMANKIVGMSSMMLLEIAMIREAVISYRPNEAIEFIGNKLGYTTKIEDKIQLINALQGYSPFRNHSLESNHKGSRQKIVDTIMTFT
jgi:hypothetical protein